MCKFGYLIKLILIWGFGYYVTSFIINPKISVATTTYLDQFIPFIGWTGWIYLSLPIWMYYVGRNIFVSQIFKHFYRSYKYLILSSLILFILFPTHIEREISTDFIMQFIYIIDPSSHKALPSLHISMMVLPLLYLRRLNSQSIIFYLWALLIAVSCLTTKQHNLLDIISGAGFAFIVYGFFEDIKHKH